MVALLPLPSGKVGVGRRFNGDSLTLALSRRERGLVLFDPVVLHFLAQRVPVYADQFGGARLVAARVVQHGLDQRLLHATDHHVIYRAGWLLAIQILEIVIHRLAYMLGNIVLVDSAILCHAASSLS